MLCLFPGPADREDVVAPHEMAVLDSIVSGGYGLSLKAHFLTKVPNLSILRSSLIYLNLSFNSFEVGDFRSRFFYHRIFFPCFNQAIPEAVFELEGLEILKLRDNPIREIPVGIAALWNLRTLVVSFCMIEKINGRFDCCVHTRHYIFSLTAYGDSPSCHILMFPSTV